MRELVSKKISHLFIHVTDVSSSKLLKKELFCGLTLQFNY